MYLNIPTIESLYLLFTLISTGFFMCMFLCFLYFVKKIIGQVLFSPISCLAWLRSTLYKQEESIETDFKSVSTTTVINRLTNNC